MAISKNNVWHIGCNRVSFSGSCQNITAINCSDFAFNPSHNDRVYVLNQRVLPNTFTTAVYSALSPTIVNGAYGSYLVNTSGGNVTFQFDVVALTGCEVVFKIIDATNNFVITTATNAEFYFDTADNALPFTYNLSSPTAKDTIRIWSDGVKLYIR